MNGRLKPTGPIGATPVTALRMVAYFLFFKECLGFSRLLISAMRQ